jgi:hypothetical protein
MRAMNASRASAAALTIRILRRLENFMDEPLRTALKHHEKRATMVLDLEEKSCGRVKKLKERELVSP